MCGGAVGQFVNWADKTSIKSDPIGNTIGNWANDHITTQIAPQWATDEGRKGLRHPVESALIAIAAYEGWSTGMYYGAGEAGAAGAADGAAGGGAAAGGSGGAAGAGGTAAGGTGATAGGSAAAGGSSLWGTAGKAAAQAAATAAVQAAVAPKPPKTKAPIAMPDQQSEEEAQRRALIEQISRRGRASTILTSPGDGGSGSLGG